MDIIPMDVISGAGSALQEQQLPLPLLPSLPLPKFELVPYDSSASAARLAITTGFLEGQKKSDWNPATWWELVFGPSKAETERREVLTIFEGALNDHEYREIGESAIDRVRLLAILERIFGPLVLAPTGVPFHNLSSRHIFNVLETFYEYSKFFNRLTIGNKDLLCNHIIHFLPTASASPLPINFIALSILNATIKTISAMPPQLETSLANSYRDTLVRTNSDFIRHKSCEGLAILNINPIGASLAARVKVITKTVKESSGGIVLNVIISIGGIIVAVGQIIKAAG